MKSFNIDADNNITALTSKKDAEGVTGDIFHS